MNAEFWKNRRVFITGQTGFKGAWLTAWLSLSGANIAALALEPNTNPNLFSLLDLDNKITSHIGDIRSIETVQSIIDIFQPDIVFHLAAQPLVRKGYLDPHETYSTNVMGTVNVLESARKCESVKAIVNITSDKCYGNKEAASGYVETDVLGGCDPYSNSKACAEFITNAYRESFFSNQVGLATARAGNVIGGGDWSAYRLMTDIIFAIQRKQNLFIRYPHAVRPWQHVLDCLSGYIELAEKLYASSDFSGAWNFGPNENAAISVTELIKKIELIRNEKIKITVCDEKKFHETEILKLNSEKAKSQLQWKPYLTVDEAIKWTCDWYDAWMQKKNMASFTIKQIHEYALLKNTE